MKLNHLDLQVPDVQATAAFFERHFGLAITSNRASPALVFLRDDDGFVLVLQRATGEHTYPDGFHVGFLVETDAVVRETHARLTDAGCPRVSPVEVNNRGVMFYCRAPGEIVVEVSCRRR